MDYIWTMTDLSLNRTEQSTLAIATDT